MNLQEFTSAGLDQEIVNRLQDVAQIQRLREMIGYPSGSSPSVPVEGGRQEYWNHLFRQIDAGILPTGNDLRQVVNAAAEILPGNPLFQQHRGSSSSLQSDQPVQSQQPYQIRQLFVEGPDESRFEITDLSSETRVQDLARAVLNQYENPKIFKDSRGQPRRTVVDRLSQDGSTERLNSSETLREHGIRDGDTIAVSPEATAGSLNQEYCEEARARARLQVGSYARTHKGFQVEMNALQAPTEYILKFSAPGFAPPETPTDQPRKIDDHQVYLFLPGTFPMQAPEAYWQTPIFHPNVDSQTGYVCLGGLGKYYQPGLDFREICQLLVDIASYRNYAAEEGFLNADAHNWSETDEGKQAIIQRGGRIPNPEQEEDRMLTLPWGSIKRLEF